MSPTPLFVREFGAPSAAQTVVLLSSIGTTHETWRELVPDLAGFRVLALDHLGHGRSARADVEPGETSMADLAHNVLATLDTVGVDTFSVVGLSLGGALAQYLAATSDRVEKAVFASTATFLGGHDKWDERTRTARTEGMGALADGIVANWFTEEFRASHPETVSWVRDMVAAQDGEGYAQNGDALADWDFAAHLGEITVPVLTVAGAGDPTTGPALLTEIARGVGGPVHSVVVEPGSHQVALENPDAFNRAVTDFLNG